MRKILFFLLAAMLFSGCTQQQPQQGEQQETIAAKTGALRVSLTDQEAQLPASIWVSISSIEVHRDGLWEQVFEGSKTFDLLKLNGVKELIGEKDIPAGKYTQVRMGVSKAEVVEAGETKPVKVPSEKIKLVKSFDVIEGQTTEIVIDFDPYSVIVESNQLILKPVIKALAVSEFNEKVAQAKKQKEEAKTEAGKPKIQQLSFPPSAQPGGSIAISWKVNGEGNIEHTAVHWDAVGGKGEDFKAYANRSEILSGKAPEEFSVQITAPASGSVFFRAHAIVDGAHVYSPEQQIVVSAGQLEQEVQEFSVKVNDRVFDPASIEVKKGSLVKITFTVDTTNVSFGGEDIRSKEFETGTIAPGASKQVQFTAKDSFTVSAYWPNTNNWKADMQVVVK